MLFPLLTVLFVGLKLTGFIGWSWWLVLLPLLVQFVLWFLAFLVALFVV